MSLTLTVVHELTSVLTVGLVAELTNSPQFEDERAKVVTGAVPELAVVELPYVA